VTAPEAKWGAFRWGDALWGAGVPASTPGTTQSSQANALKSTVVLGLSDTPETDLSQYATDLTAAGNGAYETSSARGAITSPRSIYVRTVVDPGTHTVRTIAYHGDTSLTDFTYQIQMDLSGDFDFLQNASSLLTVSGSDFAAGSLDLSIHWSTRDNEDTTGASDAVISEVSFYDHTNSTWHHYPAFAHAISTTDTSWNLSVGGYWDGGAWQQDVPNQVEKWRVDGAAMSTTHFGAHWVSNRTGAPTDLAERMEPLPPTRASGIGSQNEFVGPQFFYALKHHQQARLRMLSPFVNETYGSNANALDNTYAPTHWMKKPPGSSVYRWVMPFLRWVCVPDNCNYVYTRVLVHSTVSSGGSVPTGIRCYCFNRIPTVGNVGYDGEAPQYEATYRGEVVDVDNGGGEGQWAINAYMPVKRLEHSSAKFHNTTHLCLAYAVDPNAESGNDANELFKILAWQAWPVVLEDPEGPGNGGIGG